MPRLKNGRAASLWIWFISRIIIAPQSGSGAWSWCALLIPPYEIERKKTQDFVSYLIFSTPTFNPFLGWESKTCGIIGLTVNFVYLNTRPIYLAQQKSFLIFLSKCSAPSPESRRCSRTTPPPWCWSPWSWPSSWPAPCSLLVASELRYLKEKINFYKSDYL